MLTAILHKLDKSLCEERENNKNEMEVGSFNLLAAGSGWYMPSYLLDQDASLATWEGFTFPATPDAHTLLSNMNYTTEDQIEMIAAVEIEGQSVEDAAQAWVDANEAVWSAWLP